MKRFLSSFLWFVSIPILVIKVLVLKVRRHKRRYWKRITHIDGLVKARTLYVIDGDTVDVLVNGRSVRIRLSGIDCPEDGQPWSHRAKSALIGMIGGRDIYLQVFDNDIYGRTVAVIYTRRNTRLININERMVVCGHAWVMRRYYRHLSKANQYQLNRCERWAKSKRVGLWKSDNPIPPWLWRRTDSA